MLIGCPIRGSSLAPLGNRTRSSATVVLSGVAFLELKQVVADGLSLAFFDLDCDALAALVRSTLYSNPIGPTEANLPGGLCRRETPSEDTM